MPIVDSSSIDWAKEIDEKDTEIEYKADEGFKKIIEYKYDEDEDKRYKITNIFRIDRVKLPRAVAERKKFKKFGDASDDPPGVNPATTVVGDEVSMQFLTNKEDQFKDDTPTTQVPKIQCRLCKGDHWTTKCPLKEYYERLESGKTDAIDPKTAEVKSDVYRPPGMRGDKAGASGGGGGGVSMGGRDGGKRYDSKGGAKGDEFTVRVTNLPEEATENDLMELFKPFGKVNRIFLAKDKISQASRGFAFVNFQHREDAQRAIYGVNDYGYHHLILKVEWAK